MLKKLPEILFLLLVASLPFANPSVTVFYGLPVQATEFLFAGAIAATCAALLKGTKRIAPGRFHILLAIYLAFIYVSALFSVDPQTSFLKTSGIAYLAGLAVLAFTVVDSREMLERMVKVWLGATVFAAAFSLIVAVLFYVDRDSVLVSIGRFHYGTLPAGEYPRVRSFFLNANMLAHYLSIGWVFLLAAYELRWFRAWTILIAGAVIAIAGALTISPGIGGFFFCSGIWLILVKPERKRRILAAGMLAAAALFIAAAAVKIGPDLRPLNEPSARMMTWTASLSTFLANPLTGKGVGTNSVAVRYEDQYLSDAHNLFLNVAAESGTGAVVSIFVLGIWLALNGLRRGPPESARDPLASGLAIAFAGAFFYQGVTGSFEDARHLWVLAGVLAVSPNLSSEAGPDSEQQE